jgi:hypothetical protein
VICFSEFQDCSTGRYGGYHEFSFYASGHFKFIVFYHKCWSNWDRTWVPEVKKIPLADCDVNNGTTKVPCQPSRYSNQPKWASLKAMFA